MNIFCRHEWKLLNETVTKSKFEVATNALSDRTTSMKLPWQMSDSSRKHIQVFTCNKCGKLKRFVEDI